MIDRIDILEPGGARSGWNDSGYIIDRNAMLHDILEKLIDMGEGVMGGSVVSVQNVDDRLNLQRLVLS